MVTAFFISDRSKVNVINYRNATRENREAALQQMDVYQLWNILERDYGRQMPAPSMFDEEAHYFLKVRFVAEILKIEYGC
jgi:hypothetical protein